MTEDVAVQIVPEDETPEQKKIRELESEVKLLVQDHKMMSKVLVLYRDAALIDAFGEPFYFADKALSKRKVKL